MAWRNNLGYMVTATARAHAAADVDTFTIAGGLVCINLIYGVITVAGGACNINVGNNPTSGTATTVVWCVVGAVGATLVDDFLTLAPVAGQLTTVITGESGSYKLIGQTGTIFVRGSAAEGTSQWTLFYVPITAGATIVTV